MPIITIYTKDGRTKVEVNEGVENAYKGFERERDQKKKQRRVYPRVSMNAMEDGGYEFPDHPTEHMWDDLLDRLALAEKINARIKELPPRQHEVVRLFMRGFTEAQIARKLGVSKPAVSKLKNKLQERFKDFARGG